MNTRFGKTAATAALVMTISMFSAAKVQADDDAAIVVDGVPLSKLMLETLVQARINEWYGEEADRDEIREEAIDDLVTTQLLYQEARRRGLHEDPQVIAELELQRKTRLGQHLVRGYYETIEVSEEEIRERYEREEPDMEYRLAHILVDSEDAARRLLERLEGGADFGRLARRHSKDDEAARDGTVGWMADYQMTGDFRDAVLALEEGKYAPEPVQTGHGWHLVKLHEKRAQEKPPLEEARDWLREDIQQEKFQAWVDELREKAEVELRVP